jgi:hypothetical protein
VLGGGGAVTSPLRLVLELFVPLAAGAELVVPEELSPPIVSQAARPSNIKAPAAILKEVMVDSSLATALSPSRDQPQGHRRCSHTSCRGDVAPPVEAGGREGF